ncbi:MAG: hypothetical protein AB7E77_09020, partial [Desulfobulbus sp.]
VIAKLSWDLFTPVPAQTLLELLPEKGLTFTFSGPLDGSLIEKARGHFFRVRLHGQNNLLYALPGKITFSSRTPNVITWTCTLSADVLAKYINFDQETSLRIDLLADCLRGSENLPVSGSIGPLLGLPGPYMPGGILACWMMIA